MPVTAQKSKLPPRPAYPETTEFFIVGPERVLGSDEDKDTLVERMTELFPECTFSIPSDVFCSSPEVSLIPLLGSVGDETNQDRVRMLDRPSPQRHRELMEALMRITRGKAALS